LTLYLAYKQNTGITVVLKMKNRKLWWSFGFIVLAGLSGRLARLYIYHTAGIVLMITAAAFVATALILFAVYFKE